MLYLLFIVLVIFFAPPFATRWLARQMNRPLQPVSWLWLAAALMAIILVIGFFVIVKTQAANFILHAVGGGVVASLLYAYGSRALGINLPWRLDILLLFAFVSALGCLNELAEFGLDLLHIGRFSTDYSDTWRDILANTSGGVVGWLVTRRIGRR